MPIPSEKLPILSPVYILLPNGVHESGPATQYIFGWDFDRVA